MAVRIYEHNDSWSEYLSLLTRVMTNNDNEDNHSNNEEGTRYN